MKKWITHKIICPFWCAIFGHVRWWPVRYSIENEYRWCPVTRFNGVQIWSDYGSKNEAERQCERLNAGPCKRCGRTTPEGARQ